MLSCYLKISRCRATHAFVFFSLKDGHFEPVVVKTATLGTSRPLKPKSLQPLGILGSQVTKKYSHFMQFTKPFTDPLPACILLLFCPVIKTSAQGYFIITRLFLWISSSSEAALLRIAGISELLWPAIFILSAAL